MTRVTSLHRRWRAERDLYRARGRALALGRDRLLDVQRGFMEQEQRLYPMLSNDDLHSDPADPNSGRFDYYRGWTNVRVRERTPDAILAALASGASYGSTGPEIHNISIEKGAEGEAAKATIRCSEAQRVFAVCSTYGTQFYNPEGTFEEATVTLRAGSKWVRFEVVGPDGSKAWSNPVDLTE